MEFKHLPFCAPSGSYVLLRTRLSDRWRVRLGEFHSVAVQAALSQARSVAHHANNVPWDSWRWVDDRGWSCLNGVLYEIRRTDPKTVAPRVSTLREVLRAVSFAR